MGKQQKADPFEETGWPRGRPGVRTISGLVVATGRSRIDQAVVREAEFPAGRWIGLMFEGRMDGWAGGQTLRQLHVGIDDGWADAVLAAGTGDSRLARLLEDPGRSGRFASGGLPPRLWAACGELFQPELRGGLLALVAEARALELVAAVAGALDGAEPRPTALRARDAERLHEARGILDAELGTRPPWSSWRAGLASTSASSSRASSSSSPRRSRPTSRSGGSSGRAGCSRRSG